MRIFITALTVFALFGSCRELYTGQMIFYGTLHFSGCSLPLEGANVRYVDADFTNIGNPMNVFVIDSLVTDASGSFEFVGRPSDFIRGLGIMVEHDQRTMVFLLPKRAYAFQHFDICIED